MGLERREEGAHTNTRGEKRKKPFCGVETQTYVEELLYHLLIHETSALGVIGLPDVLNRAHNDHVKIAIDRLFLVSGVHGDLSLRHLFIKLCLQLGIRIEDTTTVLGGIGLRKITFSVSISLFFLFLLLFHSYSRKCSLP